MDQQLRKMDPIRCDLFLVLRFILVGVLSLYFRVTPFRFSGIWMDQEIIILNERTQTLERQTSHGLSHIQILALKLYNCMFHGGEAVRGHWGRSGRGEEEVFQGKGNRIHSYTEGMGGDHKDKSG